MVDIVNGVDDGPLSGWVIVIAHGQVMIGKEGTDDVTILSPVYGLTCLMQMVQRSPREQPQLMTVRQATPFLTLPSIKHIDVPAGAIVIGCETLSKSERRELQRSIEACDQLMEAMRAQESGIVVARPGARLP